MKNRERREQTARVIEAARKQVGYRAQPDRKSAFAARKEYLGQPWNGAFVNRVLTDAFGTQPEVSFVSTVAALGYYVNRNGVYRKPRVGDVVFFNFATDPQRAFEQPHVGIVTALREGGSFETVEGETSPGNPQGSQLADGVFNRERHVTDVIGFVRPKARTVNRASGEPARLKMSHFESNPSTRAKAVETVQRALNRFRPALTFNRGKKDGTFKSALGMYARETGTVENRGETVYPVINGLGIETGEYVVE